MSEARCSKCGSSQLRWATMKRQVTFDLLQCQTCGHVVDQQDWMAPTFALQPSRCMNCGHHRDSNTGRCGNCALSFEEDVQVHDELRHMVAPQLELLDAAREASRVGRRLIALKLATAAAVLEVGKPAAVARALRIWLLSAIGEATAALADAKAWVTDDPEAPAMAWASYGQQLQHNSFDGPAADAYHQALLKDPYQHTLRARRARILLGMRRDGQAMDETTKVFANGAGDDEAIKIATEVAEELCTAFEAQNRDDEIARMLEVCDAHVDASALLLAHRARLCALQGETAAAKRDLKRAKRIDPELEIYERVERAIRPQRGSWWRW